MDGVFDVVSRDGVQPLSWSEICQLGDRGIVLYFYPKNNTSGCTLESQDFSDSLGDFSAAGYAVIGVSKDSVSSHEKFIKKRDLLHPLIADTSLVLHDHFSTLGEKKMYGKTYQGTIRSTFVLDHNGVVLHEWRKVRAKGHVTSIIEEFLS